jgi:hypothetical protein
MRLLSHRTLLLSAIALCAAAPSEAQPAAPALPSAVPSAAVPATSRVLRVAAGGNFQAALDSAHGGDAIELSRGATFAGAFILPAKGACTASTGWIVIRPAAGAALPPSGTRMTPATAAALQLPVIRSVDAGNAIQTALAACHYHIVGVEVTLGASVRMSYGLVGFGMDKVQGQTSLATTAHDLVLDRVYVHGSPTVSLRRCVALNSGSAAVVDSWLSECHDDSADAQAIGGWNGPGPFLIQNNELQGSTENVMFGGSDAAITALSPADITIRRNHLSKPAAWIGGRWHIKNLFELKNAQRVLVEANVLEGSWPRDWDGTAVAFKSTNQDCGPAIGATADVTFRRNLIRHVGSGINLAAGPGCPERTLPMTRVAITHNLVLGINAAPYSGAGNGFFTGGAMTDLTIDHNTLTWVGRGAGVNMDDYDHPMSRVALTNNLFAGAGGTGLQGQALGYPGTSIPHFMQGASPVLGNVFAVGKAFSCCQDPSRNWDTFPLGNRMVVNDDTLFAPIGFVNGAAGDVRLAASSQHRGFATDGTDPGADVAAVLAATAGVVEGVTPDTLTDHPVPITLTAAQVAAAIAALDKVIGPTGREAKAIKAALTPLAAYLRTLTPVRGAP